MKPGKCVLTNFGSYKELEFDFADLGLVGVYGPTGAGKSTLFDAVSWILYGVTSKNGAVDDVRNWENPNETTKGNLLVQSSRFTLCVNRTRGSATQNDLFWTEEGSDEKHRGKDLADTQKLLEQVLGVSKETFLLGACFHEHSESARFFDLPAGKRRSVFEQLTRLDLPTRLVATGRVQQKEIKAELTKVNSAYEKNSGALEQCKRNLGKLQQQRTLWEKTQKEVIEDYEEKAANFEKEKEERLAGIRKQISDLCKDALPTDEIDYLKQRNEELIATRCGECGGVVGSDEIAANRQTIHDEQLRQIRLKDLIKQETEIKNDKRSLWQYALESEKAEINPFTETLGTLSLERAALTESVRMRGSAKQCLQEQLNRLERIQDLCADLRAELLKRAVTGVQDATNDYLEKYFDAEMRVQFSVQNTDNLDVTLYKSGYECNFKQLSKGQRRMLTLCFSLAVMQAATNASGSTIECLFLDEPSDGMSSELKQKAFRLYQSLALGRGTVMVVEHDRDVQNMFDRRYQVELVDDSSVIEADNEN